MLEVTLLFTAVDAAGKPITDLQAGDVAVYEDGVLQTIIELRRERSGVSVVLAIDSSESMTYRMTDAIGAAREFASYLGESDELLLIDFDSDVRVLGPWGTKRGESIAALEGATAGGATLLYDALWEGEDRLAARPGRRVIVVLSDGEDGSFGGGSRHNLRQVVERAQRDDVEIHSVGVGLAPNRDELQTLARNTGGSSAMVTDSSALKSIYGRIPGELREGYTVTYRSSTPVQDGRFRLTEIRVDRENAVVRSRPGYYAPGPPRRSNRVGLVE